MTSTLDVKYSANIGADPTAQPLWEALPTFIPNSFTLVRKLHALSGIPKEAVLLVAAHVSHYTQHPSRGC